MSTKLGLQETYITLNNLCVFIHMQCSSVSNNVCASHILCGSSVEVVQEHVCCTWLVMVFCMDLVWKL
jgi:hypothetical protein